MDGQAAKDKVQRMPAIIRSPITRIVLAAVVSILLSILVPTALGFSWTFGTNKISSFVGLILILLLLFSFIVPLVNEGYILRSSFSATIREELVFG